uniref:Uncharacterized protein n=1 Tax=Cacopsylla melanoneura TaxID=428564 RepID=A0A8D9F2N6_9HEMI
MGSFCLEMSGVREKRIRSVPARYNEFITSTCTSNVGKSSSVSHLPATTDKSRSSVIVSKPNHNLTSTMLENKSTNQLSSNPLGRDSVIVSSLGIVTRKSSIGLPNSSHMHDESEILPDLLSRNLLEETTNSDLAADDVNKGIQDSGADQSNVELTSSIFHTSEDDKTLPDQLSGDLFAETIGDMVMVDRVADAEYQEERDSEAVLIGELPRGTSKNVEMFLDNMMGELFDDTGNDLDVSNLVDNSEKERTEQVSRANDVSSQQ